MSPMTLPRDELKEALEAARKAFTWLDRRGGLGYDAHDEIRKCVTKIDAALSSSPPEEKGDWVPVPREPTQDMVVYGLAALVREIERLSPPRPPLRDDMTEDEKRDRYVYLGSVMRCGSEVTAAYREMLAHSPAPSLPASPPDGTVGEMLAKLPIIEQALQDAGKTYGLMTQFANVGRDYLARLSKAKEELSSLAAHLRSQDATVGAWQPIETAPKDGSYVLVSNGNHVDVARYSHGGFGGFVKNGDALFWQPLPAPPALAAAPAQEAR